MLDLEAVRRTFRNQLLTVDSISDELVLKGENRAFTPPEPPTLFIEEQFALIGENVVSSGLIMTEGRVRFIVHGWMNNKGVREPAGLALEIANAFVPPRS